MGPAVTLCRRSTVEQSRQTQTASSADLSASAAAAHASYASYPDADADLNPSCSSLSNDSSPLNAGPSETQGSGRACSRHTERRRVTRKLGGRAASDRAIHRTISGTNSGRKDDDSTAKCKPRRRGVAACARLWACPFYKYDPVLHQRCLTSNHLTTTHFVRQHLLRAHPLQPFYCIFCGRLDFKTRDAADAHMRSRSCELRPFTKPPGLTVDQVSNILGKPCNLTDSQRWYRFWDAIFPNSIRPESPHVGDCYTEMSGVMRRAHQASTGPGVISSFLVMWFQNRDPQRPYTRAEFIDVETKLLTSLFDWDSLRRTIPADQEDRSYLASDRQPAETSQSQLFNGSLPSSLSALGSSIVPQNFPQASLAWTEPALTHEVTSDYFSSANEMRYRDTDGNMPSTSTQPFHNMGMDVQPFENLQQFNVSDYPSYNAVEVGRGFAVSNALGPANGPWHDVTLEDHGNGDFYPYSMST